MMAIKPDLTPRVSITLQVPAARGIELDAMAKSIGVTRHSLLIRAVDAGLPTVISHIAAAAAAAQQQPTARE